MQQQLFLRCLSLHSFAPLPPASTLHHNITGTLTKRSGEWREGGGGGVGGGGGGCSGAIEERKGVGGVQVKPAFVLSN